MRFFRDLKRYWWYALYSAKAQLRSEVAGSYLNWLWWILDPLLFMLVYMFIVKIVFHTSEDYFSAFVMIGLTVWNFFNKSVLAGVGIVRKNKSVVSKIYLPKYMLVIIKMMVLGFKMLISFALIVILMAGLKVPFTWNVLHTIPILCVLIIITMGVACILLHFGVFVQDLSNAMNILLRVVFYMSGVFYSLEKRVPKPYGHYLTRINPVAFLIDSLRGALLYGQAPNYLYLGFWFLVGIGLCAVGISVIYKYENSYVKVI